MICQLIPFDLSCIAMVMQGCMQGGKDFEFSVLLINPMCVYVVQWDVITKKMGGGEDRTSTR